MRRLFTLVVAVAALSAGMVPAAAEGGTNDYLVVLKDGHSPTRYAAKAKRTFSRAVNGFSAELTGRQARELAADPAVASVQPNRVVRADTTQTNPPSWGLDRIDQSGGELDDAYTYNTTASNVTAYIIDTGIYTANTDFGGRAVWGTNTSGDGKDADCHGHGTHVAGTVGGTGHGVAKGVRLVAVKVLDCRGNGTTESVVAGIDWVIAHHTSGPAVANLSLGGDPDPVLDGAIQRLIADGVSTVVSAGNDNGDACAQSPARTAEAITVGSSSEGDARSSYSNTGTCVDLFAPGEYITSAWTGYPSATNTISGTSMAAPHATGAAALLLAVDPATTPAQIASHIVLEATPNKVTNAGTGSPNKLLIVGTGSRPGYPVVPNPGYRAQRTGTPMTIQLSAAGGTAPYTWSAAGLPTGTSIGAGTGLISGTPTQTLVNSTITVSAKDKANRTTTVRFQATVVPPGWTCPSGGQKFLNPGFENGDTDWWSSGYYIDRYTGAEAPRTGSWAAKIPTFGSLGNKITQTVTIPRECAWSTLTFWAKVTNASPDTWDRLVVQTDERELASFPAKGAPAGYKQYTVDLSGFAGKTVRLWFDGWGDTANVANFILDDLAVNAR
ncbi:S8 family serine peptidase [Actinokineospora diospyrosa]|uniref:Serine protease, subtilisin family n=1 Tax=Actinokineospora diospyrosa TaxID=103728 RepID=A0ABT1I6A2_9PSEU|nr:S8 family serine peptidase [Actinokineospora diospyrosa]MCP2268145.1 Serine protease, subtilisin family [Actinokineospora diospyrosa]